jgi:hypothetical protein
LSMHAQFQGCWSGGGGGKQPTAIKIKHTCLILRVVMWCGL